MNLPVAEGGCYATWWTHFLVADPRYGTAYTDEPDSAVRQPRYWPSGYTGWRVGSEVEVRDKNGKVVAVTGRRYQVPMGLTPQGEAPQGLVTSAACIEE